VWDIGGQERFRDKWVLYAEHADVILFIVDSSDRDKMRIAKRELHTLLENEALSTMPVVVVSNKIDVNNHASKDELKKALNLDYIDSDQQTVSIIEISALRKIGIDQVYSVLMKHAKPK